MRQSRIPVWCVVTVLMAWLALPVVAQEEPSETPAPESTQETTASPDAEQESTGDETDGGQEAGEMSGQEDETEGESGTPAEETYESLMASYSELSTQMVDMRAQFDNAADAAERQSLMTDYRLKIQQANELIDKIKAISKSAKRSSAS